MNSLSIQGFLAISAKYRISIGLVGIVVTSILTAMLIGLLPDRHRATMEGRAALSESIALNSSVLAILNEPEALRTVLTSNVERNVGLLSAAIRKTSGELLIEAGNHEEYWELNSAARSTENQIRVPIRDGQAPWGTVELRFRPLAGEGWIGVLGHPWVLLLSFVCASCLLGFAYYLQRMLKHLDPSRAVPTRVRSALDSLAEGLLIVDVDDRIMLANNSFAELFGVEADRLVGHSASEFDWEFVVDSEEAPPNFRLDLPWLTSLREKRAVANSILRLRSAQDSYRSFNVNCSPILGADGNHRGVLVSFDDITSLEEKNEQLKEARYAADAANEAKSEFLARMSHEIRTPMNAILGYSDLLRRGIVDNDQQRDEHLTTIHSSGEHLLALINDILDLSKIEAGKMELELAKSSPVQLVSQVIQVLKIKAEEKGIGLLAEFPTKLPETITTDAVRLRQAIINLVGNAIKFTDVGSVRVVVRMEETSDSKSSHLLEIDVVDTGVGMTSEACNKIFEPFAQADTSITRKFGGTGLGLAISLQLAEKLGGDLAVQSSPGEGSRFTLTLDPGSLEGVAWLSPDELQLSVQSTNAEPSESEQIIQLPHSRILVVDDAPQNRRLASVYLKRAGAEVFEAENGKEAVELSMANEFDAILMDVHMPVMDGLTATRLLREQGFASHIIALTADVLKDDEVKCREAGCNGFLTKPISIERLLGTLSELLTDSPQPQTIAKHKSIENNVSRVQGTEENILGQIEEISQTVSSAGSERGGDAPIISSLPLDDPEILEIVESFMESLQERVQAMRAAFDTSDFHELRELGHWLKGSAGTVGFDQFSETAEAFEACAKAENLAGVEQHLREIEALQERVVLSP